MNILIFSFNLLISIIKAPEAYIDPNTGGMLFQMLAVILALFSGIIFFFSRQIKTLFARMRRKIRNEPLESAPEDPEDRP